MKEILLKMFKAKKEIAQTKIKKAGRNTYSNYDYFTPEQVKHLVDLACISQKLLTQFTIKNKTAYLIIFDIETLQKLTFSIPIEIPDIKATNIMQKIGGVVTYAERYLKMSAFGIVDNNLDFDTTENTKKTVNSQQQENISWMTENQFNQLMQIDDEKKLEKNIKYFSTNTHKMKKIFRTELETRLKELTTKK